MSVRQKRTFFPKLIFFLFLQEIDCGMRDCQRTFSVFIRWVVEEPKCFEPVKWLLLYGDMGKGRRLTSMVIFKNVVFCRAVIASGEKCLMNTLVCSCQIVSLFELFASFYYVSSVMLYTSYCFYMSGNLIYNLSRQKYIYNFKINSFQACFSVNSQKRQFLVW